MPIVALTVLTFLSGYFVRFSDAWDLLYKANLLFHPVIGLLWAVVICRGLSAKGAGLEKILRRLLGWMLVIFALGVLASSLTGSPRWFWVATGICALLTLLAMGRKTGVSAFRAHDLYNGAKILLLFGVLFLSASGVLIVAMHHGQKLLSVFRMHDMAGTGLLLLIGGMLLYGAVRRRGSVREVLSAGLGMNAGFRGRDAALLLLAAGGIVLFRSVDGKEEVQYTFHLSTTTLERRHAHEVDVIPADFPYAHLMTLVDTCGNARGCHDGIVEDHHRSTHNRSTQTTYFQRNLEYMAEEVGEHNTYICAGCHFPNAYFLPETGFRDYTNRDGWSCVYCHTVDQVHFTEEKGKTILDLRANVNHLKMFAGPDGEPGLTAWNNLLIQLNPRGHGRVFTRDLYSRDESCQVCHHLQIKPSENEGFMKGRCVDCHMQARKYIGKEGEERNHFFPGTNLAGPYDLGDPVAKRINTQYSRGELHLPQKGWGGIWSLVPKEERTIKDIWLLVTIEPLVEPKAGQPFEYRVVTTNTALDHAFPAAPLDLIEVWLETRVTDAAGRTLFESGVLDETHHIPPGTNRLGGYMIGMDDHVVTKNRVWQIKEKVTEREIVMSEQTQDVFSFDIPEDVSGPLEFYVSWNYRKLSQEFMDWAYDFSGATIPILRIAEVNHKMKLLRQAEELALRSPLTPTAPD